MAAALPGPSRRAVSFESLEQAPLSAPQAAAYAARAAHQVTFAVGRHTIAVRFSRASAAAAFAERFADMQCDRAPDTLVHAVARDGEAFFWRHAERARRWPAHADDGLLMFFADAVAMHEYLTTSPDLGIHAATIAQGCRAVALVGRSTAGKTTTAIAAVRSGFTLYSDERCIVQSGRVVPFLRALTIRPGARSALLAQGATGGPICELLRALPDHGDASVGARLLAGQTAGGPPLPLHALFVIAGWAARSSIAACPPYALLPALLRSVVSRDARLDAAARMLTELRDVACYRLWLGSPDDAVRAIRAALA